MGKLIAFFALAGVAFFAYKSCGTTGSKSVPLSGMWIFSTSSDVSGASETMTISVVTDGKNFRIKKSGEDSGIIFTLTDVYNGKILYSKKQYTYPPNSPYLSSSDEPIPVQVKLIKPKEAELMMFWMTSELNLAEAGPGGKIAGRDSLLYQTRENRPDATFSIQHWIDAEHKVLLKSSKSIFAKQVESVLSRESYECESIQFGPVDEKSFLRP